VTADLQDAAGNTGEAAGDIYVSIENLYGSQFNDSLRGDQQANAIWGAAGDDVIHTRGGDDTAYTAYGGAGNDVLLGHDGADLLDGGTGIDWAQYSAATERVIADLQQAANNTGEAAGDIYVSIENLVGSDYNDGLRGDRGANTLLGGDGNDVLLGRDGLDRLFGGDGDDYLHGGEDIDLYYGGAGRDVFVSSGGRRDQVYDFERGVDKIDVSHIEGVSSLSDLTIDLHQNGAWTRVIHSSGQVWLKGDFVNADPLDANDFVFSDEASAPAPPPNLSPLAADDDGLTTGAGQSLEIAAADLLANDSDPDGDALTVIAVADGEHNAVTLNADGTITYLPDAGFTGADEFSYTVSDGKGGTDTAKATVDVAAPPPPPSSSDAFDLGGPRRYGCVDVCAVCGVGDREFVRVGQSV